MSVICITYNHERYLRDCLEGIVGQRTTFPFEVIVHDDASTDGTTRIVREYASRYPGVVIPYVEGENRYSMGVEGLETISLPPVRGRYVAVCEGDDYWCDPLKLQAQHDYLEVHPDCSLCVHAVRVFDEEIGRFREVLRPADGERDLSVEEVIGSRGARRIGTCSLFFRNSSEPLPPAFRDWGVGDTPLLIWQATRGAVHYLDRPMAVYRANASGSWTLSMRDRDRNRAATRRIIDGFERADRFTRGRYHEAFRSIEALHRLTLCEDDRDLPGLLFGAYRDDARLAGPYRTLVTALRCALPTPMSRALGRAKRRLLSLRPRARRGGAAG